MIDTIKCKRQPTRFLGWSSFVTTTWGICEEYVQLPPIPHGSKVLDVGAGSGFLSQKIRDSLECDVYVLEPSFERASDYESCVSRLGKEYVERLTLQEALNSNPEKYFQAFDVVTVFKYNVPYAYKEEFIKSLTQVVKPGGTIFITSVEKERFFPEQFAEPLYLKEIMQKYFEDVKIEIRNGFRGSDGLMTCNHPKLLLDNKAIALNTEKNPDASSKMGRREYREVEFH